MKTIDEVALLLIRQLEDDLETSKALYEVLAQETMVLGKRNANDILTITNEKEALIQRIHKANDARKTLLSQIAPDCRNLKAGFEDAFKSLNPEMQTKIRTLNAGVEKNLNECRQKNLINRQIVETNLRDNAELLSILRGKSKDALKLYSKKGTLNDNDRSDFDTEV